MDNKIREFVSEYTKPGFFSATDEVLNEIHDAVKHSIEIATDTMTFDVDPDLMRRAEEEMSKRGWTLEEVTVLYLYWLAECPEAAGEWERGMNEVGANRSGGGR